MLRPRQSARVVARDTLTLDDLAGRVRHRMVHREAIRARPLVDHRRAARQGPGLRQHGCRQEPDEPEDGPTHVALAHEDASCGPSVRPEACLAQRISDERRGIPDQRQVRLDERRARRSRFRELDDHFDVVRLPLKRLHERLGRLTPGDEPGEPRRVCEPSTCPALYQCRLFALTLPTTTLFCSTIVAATSAVGRPVVRPRCRRP